MSENQQNDAIEEELQQPSVSNPPRDYKSYKLIFFILILVAGTFCVIRKENVDQISSERFIKERIPVLHNFTFISADSPEEINPKSAEKIIREAKLKTSFKIVVKPKDLKRIYCKYRNNDTLFSVDLYAGKEEILFFLNPPEKLGF